MVVSHHLKSTADWLQAFNLNVPDISISGMSLDSREADIYTAFVAIKGHSRDGRDYIEKAVEQGCKVVISQVNSKEEHGSVIYKENCVVIGIYELPYMLSSLSAAFYDYPATKMNVIGVTGTNGKTSVVHILTQMKHLLGSKSASIGTLGSAIYSTCQSDIDASMNTTPDAITFQRKLAYFHENDVLNVAYEASSHALIQGRISQVCTNIGVFTNLSRDHLDYHRDMASYASAKRKLISQPGLKSLVLNFDDEESKNWRKATPDSIDITYVGVAQTAPTFTQERYCFATNVSYCLNGCHIHLETSWGDALVFLPLLGSFNIYNFLAAFACLLIEGKSFDDLISITDKLTPVKGRMEIFPSVSNANAVVDYAHTPDALEQALLAVKSHTKGSIWCVFGCGGDRDKGKRPLMGAVAQKYADKIVITTDNSRSESAKDIAKEIKSGLKSTDNLYEKPDREVAFRFCVSKASKNDIILMAGKGHENYQIIGNQISDYDERAMIARVQGEYQQ